MAKQGTGRGWLRLLVGTALLILFSSTTALAHDETPVDSQTVLARIGFDQRLQAQTPPDLRFVDESGQRVRLGNFFVERPVILVMGYFECPNLCSLVRVGLLDALQEISFDAGDQFDVVLVSIDPAETPAAASRVKAETLAVYNRPGSERGWHFLTGDHETIDTLAEAVGFRYAYDAGQQQFAHASGLVLLTPAGTVARYFFGIEFDARDLRLGLIETTNNRIGSLVDQVLLFCYSYNPMTGKYTVSILRAVRIAGVGFVLLMGGMIWRMLRQENGSIHHVG